jgi:membrane protein YqaA with SNARE-associated domain
MNSVSSVTALFASSFLSATLLPGGSEIVLFALLQNGADLWLALGTATLGNTLGGMTSYAVGRLFPQRQPLRALEAFRRYGSCTLLFSWIPLVGDGLCVAAGWLRINAWAAAFFMGLGKFARYAFVAAIAV